MPRPAPGPTAVDTRLALLEKLGDPLPRLDTLIHRESFRPVLARVYRKTRKSPAGRAPSAKRVAAEVERSEASTEPEQRTGHVSIGWAQRLQRLFGIDLDSCAATPWPRHALELALVSWAVLRPRAVPLRLLTGFAGLLVLYGRAFASS